MGEAQKLLSGGFSKGTRERATATISRSTAKIERGTGLSGQEVFEDEPDRIATYIKPTLLMSIFDITDAEKVVNSLKTDPKYGDKEDFKNLLRGAGIIGKDAFAKWLFENYGLEIIERLKLSIVILKSGKERIGIRVNRDVYAIVVTSVSGREFVQFREFKTGRVTRETLSLNKRLKEALQI